MTESNEQRIAEARRKIIEYFTCPDENVANETERCRELFDAIILFLDVRARLRAEGPTREEWAVLEDALSWTNSKNEDRAREILAKYRRS